MRRNSIFFALGLFLVSCSNCHEAGSTLTTDTNNSEISNSTEKNLAPALWMLADTISYDVVIRNPDEEDEFTESVLDNVKTDEFVEKILQAIYDGKLQAYGFFDGEPLTLDDIKALEARENYSRVLIGKVQFIEEWQYDEVNFKFEKKVKEILFAYEKYDESALVIGYIGAFRVKLN